MKPSPTPDQPTHAQAIIAAVDCSACSHETRASLFDAPTRARVCANCGAPLLKRNLEAAKLSAMPERRGAGRHDGDPILRL